MTGARGMVAAAVTVAALCGAPALGAPRVVASVPLPGVPIATVAGAHGGAIVVSRAEDLSFVTIALRPDGRRLWFRTRLPACGNCDGEVPIRRRADGTVGPIGYTGDDAWAYTLTGWAARTCAGAVVADGSCVSVGTEPHPATPFDRRPVISRSRGAGEIWRIVPPGMIWQPEFEVPPTVVTDGAGMAYTTLDAPRDEVTGTPLPARTYVLRVTDGAITAQLEAAGRPVVGLTDGALMRTGRGLSALRSDGTTRWARGLTGTTLLDEALTDPPRARVVVGTSDGLTRRVTALRFGDGRIVWRTPARDGARLLALRPGGPTYVAADRGPRRGVLALDARGRAIWRLRVPTRALGLTPMRGGRVAVAIAGRHGFGGHLLVVRPAG